MDEGGKGVMISLEKSKAAFEEARLYMPGGVNSPVRSYPHMGCPPPFIKEAKGSHITDIDGNTYIDYVGSWGPMVLGHAHPAVISAIQKAAERSTSYGAPTLMETEIARLIHEVYPSIEKMRMVNSGTEATMSALRAARGYTGRDKILKFEGCYHGHGDSLLVKAGSGAATFGSPDSAGVTKGTAKDTLVVPYNDIPAFTRIMDEQGDEIAAVIVEPVAGNMCCVPPVDGFLDTLRKDCIAPDGSVYQAGTLSGNPLAVTAGIETLKQMMAIPDFDQILEKKTRALLEGWKKAADKAGVPLVCHQSGSMFGIFFSDKEVLNYQDACAANAKQFKAWFLSMLDQHIYLAPSPFETLFMSFAHSDEDIEVSIRAAEKAMEAAAKA